MKTHTWRRLFWYSAGATVLNVGILGWNAWLHNWWLIPLGFVGVAIGMGSFWTVSRRADVDGEMLNVSRTYAGALYERIRYLESVIDGYQREPYETHKINGDYYRCYRLEKLAPAPEPRGLH